MSSREVKIFSVSHCRNPLPVSDFITPIQVGRKAGIQDLGYLSDDTGNHISEKNPTHCELTALYWIWKNLDTFPENYIGLCHYRRYFILGPKESTISQVKRFIRRYALLEKTEPQSSYKRPLEEPYLHWVLDPKFPKQVSKLLKKADVILPRRQLVGMNEGVPMNAHAQYNSIHVPHDWELLRAVVIRQHPECTKAFDDFFNQATRLSFFNMFIASKEMLSKYCAWLFQILEELEPLIPIKEDPYQRRVFGFMAERLLNFYVHYYHVNAAHLPVLFFQQITPQSQGLSKS